MKQLPIYKADEIKLRELTGDPISIEEAMDLMVPILYSNLPGWIWEAILGNSTNAQLLRGKMTRHEFRHYNEGDPNVDFVTVMMASKQNRNQGEEED